MEQTSPLSGVHGCCRCCCGVYVMNRQWLTTGTITNFHPFIKLSAQTKAKTIGFLHRTILNYHPYKCFPLCVLHSCLVKKLGLFFTEDGGWHLIEHFSYRTILILPRFSTLKCTSKRKHFTVGFFADDGLWSDVFFS